MNERIVELAEQTGIINTELLNESQKIMLEKFAELIIERCIEQCWTVSELESSGYVVSECSKRVRKHFGIEQ